MNLGRVKRGAEDLLLFLLIAGISTLSLTGLPRSARAAGDPIFELRDGRTPEMIRINETTVIISAQMKISEEGLLDSQNETFYYFDVKETYSRAALTHSEFDFWKVTKIEMSNGRGDTDYGTTQSRIISPQVAEFKNRNNELVAYIDYTSLPKDAYRNALVPCMKVWGERNGLSIGVEATNSDCADRLFSDSIGNLTPAARLAVEALQGGNRRVQNYDLSDSNADADFSRDRIMNWFSGLGDIQGLEISITETAGQPPTVTVPKSKLNNPPGDLVFKQVSHSGQGSGIYIYGHVRNRDWVTFAAYVGDRKIDNLYLSVSDNLDTNFHYDTDYESLRQGKFTTATEVGSAQATEDKDMGIGKYFTYTMNLPLSDQGTVSGENCAQGIYVGGNKKLSITGPAADIKTTVELGVNGRAARELNQNCVNAESSGWLSYWGVGDIHSATPFASDGCRIDTIIGLGGLSDIINTLTQCLIDAIFRPVVEWAAGLIVDVAGISWLPREKIKLSYLGTSLRC
ncbi:MAG: hypothetical protein WEC83_01220 [Patescibacteria group bacterium]